MNPDGTAVSRLADPVDSGSVTDIAWSPAGDRIAFLIDIPTEQDGLVDHRRELYVVDNDGSDVAKLADNVVSTAERGEAGPSVAERDGHRARGPE